jgi:hypothetical protein
MRRRGDSACKVGIQSVEIKRLDAGDLRMNLREATEDDVVEAFKGSLRAFVRAEGGSFGARRVTPRQENVFPSDQDFAISLDLPQGTCLHMFGLQFKRWNGSGWTLSKKQADNLRRFGHVIAYCLPSPEIIAAANAIHSFRFVNPARVPAICMDLRLHRPAQLLPLGVTPDELGQGVRQRLDLALTLERRAKNTSLFPKSEADTIKSLHQLIASGPQITKEVADAISTRARVIENSVWGQNLIVSENSEPPTDIPYLTWGDFFDAVGQGSTIFSVPGNPGDPPITTRSPEDVFPGSGIGLTIRCSGPWGKQWIRSQIGSHIEFWARSVLESPAAIIAYESFSRSIDFIEFFG